MSAYLELAEKVEAARGLDRELGTAVMVAALGYRDVFDDGRLFDRGNDGYWTTSENDDRNPQLPDPTSSLDAAMTLVPEGDGVGYSFGGGPWAGPYARIWEITVDSALGDDPIAWEAVTNALTLPLALTAAALRARHAQEATNVR